MNDNNDISDIIKNLSSMLDNNNMPDSIKDILNNVKTSSTNTSSNSSYNDNSNSSNQIDVETMMKIANIINTLNSSQNDDRSKLLLSLKPYLRKNKKEKLDQYIKLLNMSKVFNVFNNGSDNKK